MIDVACSFYKSKALPPLPRLHASSSGVPYTMLGIECLVPICVHRNVYRPDTGRDNIMIKFDSILVIDKIPKLQQFNVIRIVLAGMSGTRDIIVNEDYYRYLDEMFNDSI